MAKIKWFKQEKEPVTQIYRGEIYLVSFDPTVGHEIKKTRPAVVIQNDIGNKYSPLTIVAAITSTILPIVHPVTIQIEPNKENGLDAISAVRLDQIRSVDKKRLVKRLGILDEESMEVLDQALQISLGLVKL
jgi:mRNA interferase MazF